MNIQPMKSSTQKVKQISMIYKTGERRSALYFTICEVGKRKRKTNVDFQETLTAITIRREYFL